MRAVVTGGAGLTGTAIVSELLRRGHVVRALVRRADAPVPDGAERVVADVTRPVEVRRATEGCELLVHVAGILLGQQVADAVRGTGGLRVVAVSSAGVYSRHRASASQYAAAEQALVSASRDVCLVRPTMIYGSERDRNVHHVIAFARRTGFLPLIGPGSALIQPIHYEDLATAVAELATRGPTGTVDAGGGAPITIREALRAIFAALGQPARILPVPMGIARAGALALERIRGGRIVERVERLLEDRVVDNERLLALTGVRPREFAAGVRDQVKRTTP